MLLGVCVGVLVALDVGVLVAFGGAPLSELTTSPADPLFLFQMLKICVLPSDDSEAETFFGLYVELILVGVDHEL